jgi:hypothetical protein
MSDECIHTDTIREVTPSAVGCEECLKIGSPWVHLRLCRTCGHVGCCDDSPNRHATKHFTRRATQSSKAMTRPKAGGGVTSRGHARPQRSRHPAQSPDYELLLKLGHSPIKS